MTLPSAILLCLCAVATPHGSKADTGIVPVLYYRLRIEFSTTSDWSTLVFDNLDRLLGMRAISQSGPPASVTASLISIALRQPCSNASSCGTVTATVDYALAATSLDQPLNWSLQKGAWNSSNLKVSVLVGNQAQTLLQVTHTGYVSGYPNAVPATVDLSPLKSISPTQAPQSSTGHLIWAIYYPWYYPAFWSSSSWLTDLPSIPYGSSDPVAIARHVAQAQAAGVDGFICSWGGPTGWLGPEPLNTLLDLASQRGFKITVLLEILDASGKPQPASTISAWLTYLISTYRDNPAFYKLNGKPLIIVWASPALTLDTWGTIFSSLHEKGLDASYLAMGYDTAPLNLFDGLYQYFVLDNPNLVATESSAGLAVHGFPMLADTPTPKIWAATVQPGFDSRLFSLAAPVEPSIFYDRANGALYRSTMDAALGSNPDWVFIGTWNEWNENTEIEPSVLYGDLYLRITRELAERWKGIPTLSNVSGASFQGPTLAPESIVAVFGTHLATQTAQAGTLPLPASLGGTTVTVVDSAGVSRAAPLFYVSPGQVNYALLAGMALGEAQVTVAAGDGTTQSANVPVAAVAPGLFTINAAGLAAAGVVRVRNGIQTNEDVFRIDTPGVITPKPIDFGPEGDRVFLILYGTGLRAAGTSGVAVNIAGVGATVDYAGLQGTFAGLDQVNVLLPRSLAGRGDVTIRLQANGVAANPVHVTIQ